MATLLNQVINAHISFSDTNLEIRYCLFVHFSDAKKSHFISATNCPSVLIEHTKIFNVSTYYPECFLYCNNCDLKYNSNSLELLQISWSHGFFYLIDSNSLIAHSEFLNTRGHHEIIDCPNCCRHIIKHTNLTNLYLETGCGFDVYHLRLEGTLFSNITCGILTSLENHQEEITASDCLFINIHGPRNLVNIIFVVQAEIRVERLYFCQIQYLYSIREGSIEFKDCFIDDVGKTCDGVDYASSLAYTIAPINPEVFTTPIQTDAITKPQQRIRSWVIYVSVFGGIGLIVCMTLVAVLRIMRWRRASAMFEKQLLIEKELSQDYG